MTPEERREWEALPEDLRAAIIARRMMELAEDYREFEGTHLPAVTVAAELAVTDEDLGNTIEQQRDFMRSRRRYNLGELFDLKPELEVPAPRVRASQWSVDPTIEDAEVVEWLPPETQ